MSEHETRNILMNNLDSEHRLVIWPVYIILQDKISYQNIL